VPILGDIPLLGWFFKHKTVENSKTNLLVFITPHIVTKEEKLEAITNQKRESQRRIRIK
jgi:general secretion pathway protein D